MASSYRQQPKLKLLVDKTRRKVLFAEANKDDVDFLFNILALPLSEVVRLLTKRSMVGSLGYLYRSVETMDETYMEANRNRSRLLAPVFGFPVFSGKAGAALTWPTVEENCHPRKYYCCRDFFNNCRGPYYSDDWNATCPRCFSNMTRPMKYVPPPVAVKVVMAASSGGGAAGEGGGFVKGMVTYMVKDNLTVVPISTITSIALSLREPN